MVYYPVIHKTLMAFVSTTITYMSTPTEAVPLLATQNTVGRNSKNSAVLGPF